MFLIHGWMGRRRLPRGWIGRVSSHVCDGWSPPEAGSPHHPTDDVIGAKVIPAVRMILPTADGPRPFSSQHPLFVDRFRMISIRPVGIAISILFSRSAHFFLHMHHS